MPASNKRYLVNLYHFQVNFEWEQWSAWSDCSLSCGDGSKKRQRGCKVSKHGGQECPKDDHKINNDYRETKKCFIKKCPGLQKNFYFDRIAAI